MLKISVVIVTYNRSASLKLCLANVQLQTHAPYEILVVDNASHDDTLAMLAQHYPDVRVIKSPVNLGIAAGRNAGYQQARGDICVTIDDDAVFESDTALERVLAYYEKDHSLACISFEVKDADGRIIKNYIPRRDRKIIDRDSPGASFVGTGHAVHKERFVALEGFWEQLGLYFGEEPDLSYRILEAGYTIWHTKAIAVIHHESGEARPSGRRIYHGTRNTPWIALKNLPWQCVLSLTMLAWGYYLVEALKHGCVKDYLRGLVDCLGGVPAVLKQRKCISPNTIALVKRYSGVYAY